MLRRLWGRWERARDIAHVGRILRQEDIHPLGSPRFSQVGASWAGGLNLPTMISPADVYGSEASDVAVRDSTHLEVRAPSGGAHDAATCPLGLAINTIGGRWKLHVLRALLLGGPQRYNALLGLIDGISPKELTRNLRELESAQLVVRVEHEGIRCYTLSALGRELEVPFRALGMFGAALAARRI